MFNVIDKASEEVRTVYDVRNDNVGFPHFLIYTDGQWVWRSAKHFKPEPERLSQDYGFVMGCAVRYACGRKTYAPSIVIGHIEPLLPKLDDTALAVMERDIRECENYGDEMIDEPDWLDFLDKIQAEMGRRHLNIL